MLPHRLRSAVRREARVYSTASSRVHLGILTVALVALVVIPDTEDWVLPGCLATVLAFECAVVSALRGDGTTEPVLRLRAQSFTEGAARLVARVVSVCAAACVVTFLLPVVVLVASPSQRDPLFVFLVLVLAILTARLAYLRVAAWRAGYYPPPGLVGRSLATWGSVYEESCRILIPANARLRHLQARVHWGRVLSLLLRATFLLALAALAVLLALEFFAMPAFIPGNVVEEDLAAVAAEGLVVFPTMAIVGVLVVDALQWLRRWETGHELVATAHVVAAAAAVAVVGDRFEALVSWAGSTATGLAGPDGTAASLAVGAAFGLVGALFFDTASSMLTAIVFLTRPHAGLPREELLDEGQRTVPRASTDRQRSRDTLDSAAFLEGHGVTSPLHDHESVTERP